jgi:RNA polymerase sigma-70 factor (ECF subfamily)
MDAQCSDLSLVQRVKAGDRRAFDTLVIRYQAMVLKLIMRYVQNASDAEDACQEAFIAAYRGLHRFRGDCSFQTWLHRIGINAAKNVLIARARHRCLVSLTLPEVDFGVEAPRALRDLDTPESLVLTEDIRLTVHRALELLPEGHRRAILLREIDGLSYEQIASAMAIPMGTVRSRVFRAREIVDRHLRQVHDAGLGRGNPIRTSPARSPRPRAA